MNITITLLFTSLLTALFHTGIAYADDANLFLQQHQQKANEIRESNMTEEEKLKAFRQLQEEKMKSIKAMSSEERSAVADEAKRKFEEASKAMGE